MGNLCFAEEKNNKENDPIELVLEKSDQEKEEEKTPKYNPKKFKLLTLRVLNKATSVKKDVTFTPKDTEQTVFDLKITCEQAFEEKVNNALYVRWAFLDIYQDYDKQESTVLYSGWFNDLKSIFQHPDYDIKIMAFKL